MGSPDAGKRFLELAVSQRCPKDNEPLDFDGVALRGLAVVSAEHGAVECRLPVTRHNQNRYGTLHGGCIGECHIHARAACALPGGIPPSRSAEFCVAGRAATLVDTVGTAALVSVSKKGGVSLNINASILQYESAAWLLVGLLRRRRRGRAQTSRFASLLHRPTPLLTSGQLCEQAARGPGRPDQGSGKIPCSQLSALEAQLLRLPCLHLPACRPLPASSSLSSPCRPAWRRRPPNHPPTSLVGRQGGAKHCHGGRGPKE